jgi:hypothetical protein
VAEHEVVGRPELEDDVVQDAPAADSYSGETTRRTAAAALAFGAVCYIDAAGQCAKADATAAATTPACMIAVASIAHDSAGRFLLPGGVVHVHTLAPSWTIGGVVYLAKTAGTMTQTAPAASTNAVQVLGVALAADTLLFEPCLQVEIVP